MGSRLLPSPVIRIAFTRGNINSIEVSNHIIIETLTPHPHGVVGATAVRFSVAGRQALLNVKRRRAWYATHNRQRHTQNEKHLRKQPGTKLKKEKKVLRCMRIHHRANLYPSENVAAASDNTGVIRIGLASYST